MRKLFKNILIFQTGEPTHFDKLHKPMRLVNLADSLISKGHKVKVITSLFFHQEKKFRTVDQSCFYSNHQIEYNFIKSSGYRKNISISRIIDHFFLAYNLSKKLKKLKNIDLAFVGFPPIETSYVLARWCKKMKIPYIIDCKDLWPELFINNKNFFFKILIYPYYFLSSYLRKYVLMNATHVSMISENFIQNIPHKKKVVCYLTKKKTQNQIIHINKKIKDIFLNTKKKKIVFIGNFMEDAYDFTILNKMKEYIIGSKKFEFHFFGEGPSKKKFMKILNFKNIFFHGRTNSHEFDFILNKSSAVFLPIKNRFDYLRSVPNKVIDAIQYKLPIFTSLKGVTEKIINKYNIGYVFSDHDDLKYKLEKFFEYDFFIKISDNYNNKDIKSEFDHDLNYKKILDKI